LHTASRWLRAFDPQVTLVIARGSSHDDTLERRYGRITVAHPSRKRQDSHVRPALGPSDAPPGGRLLVVEDDPQLMRVLERLLGSFGHEVVVTTSCREARDAGAFAVGIFDIGLPDGDGVELAWDLLASGRIAHAVFFTGSSDHTDLRRAEDCGVVIPKSRGVAVLRVAIAAQLEDPGPRRARRGCGT
jgi:CheY-like chemotaxis protein